MGQLEAKTGTALPCYRGAGARQGLGKAKVGGGVCVWLARVHLPLSAGDTHVLTSAHIPEAHCQPHLLS